MVEELREQIVEEGEVLEYVEEKPLQRFLTLFKDLVSWQKLVLALLVFVNVALCGCMLLVMAGRIFPPF